MEEKNIIGNDISLYVICNDRNLLDNINGMLSRNGIIGVMDGTGKVQYMVDARKDKTAAMAKINKFITSRILPFGDNNSLVYDSVARTVFEEYGFDMAHIGSVIIYEAIKDVLHRGGAAPSNVKHIYLEASVKFDMTFDQIARDVRYSIKASLYPNMRTATLIKDLSEEISDRMEGKKPKKNKMR